MLLLGGGGYHIQCEFLCPPSRPLLSPFLMALHFPFIPELENRHCHHSRMSAQRGSGPWPKAPQLTLSHTCKLTCPGVAPSQPTFNLMGGHVGILLAPFSILGKPRLHKAVIWPGAHSLDRAGLGLCPQVSCLSELSSVLSAAPPPSMPVFPSMWGRGGQDLC